MNTDEPQDDLSTDGGLDAQRDIHQTIARRNHRRNRYRYARCRPSLSRLHHRTKLGRCARDDCDIARPIG